MRIHPIIEELAAERRAQDLSQRAVGRAAGARSSATVNAWERGLASPTLDHLTDWANALGFDVVLEDARC